MRMKTAWFVTGVAVVIVAFFILIKWFTNNRLSQQPVSLPTPAIQTEEAFELQSSAFPAGGIIPAEYTCDGQDSRPPLTIRGVPPDTKSLAIVMYDPDAPGGTFVHWVAWNIPPETKELPVGPLPEGIKEGVNSFRSVGYQGPCPPSGTHRYIWRLYALRKILTLESNTTREQLETAVNTYVITQTELMARYTKQ